MSYDPNKGRLLANRYELQELVGEGAMGRVYSAKDTLLGGVTVAVKFLSQTLLNQKMRDRFEREVIICALLGEKSNHIVRVIDYGDDEHNIPFYVMEFLSGESLSDIIRFEPLPLKRFLHITRQICLGLESAHEGIIFKGQLSSIIHRDIKPSNILVTSDRTLNEWVKILDFGIAKLIQSSEAQTHSFMGTLAYCSPEQMEGKELDIRSDIYSLGVMMYEMLTCEMALMPETSSFGGWYIAHHETAPKKLSPDFNLPPTLEKLVMQCLAKDPEQRPQNISQILQVLETIQPDRTQNPISIAKPKSLPCHDEICAKASWPQDKPQQEIVFPRLIPTKQAVIPTLFVMLEYQDLLNRISSTRYKHFLFLPEPHPMVLWLTVLYSRQHGPRWLPCYLDLKQPQGQQIIHALADTGSYGIVMFALGKPQKCQKILTSNIASQQCKLFKEWAKDSLSIHSNDPKTSKKTSKKRLKEEYQQLKPKIMRKLEAAPTGYPSSISGFF